MKFYLSARFDRKDELKKYRDRLEMLGHTNVSTWLDGDPTGRPETAITDLDDVKSADVLISFSEDPVEFSCASHASRGGRHVETGIAMASGVWVLVVGPIENVFHHHPIVEQVNDFDAALTWMGGMQEMLDMVIECVETPS